MNRFSLVAATLALSLFCTPNVVSATNSLPQTPSEWMDFLEKQSINQEDYGNSDQNFVTDSLPLVKDSAQKPDPNVIKIMIDPGHANYYNPSTVVNGYYESVMTWTLSNYLKEELETLRQSYAEQAPRLIPLRDELLKLSRVQHNVDLLLREREERHHSEISR